MLPLSCSGGAKQRKFMTKDDVINLASKFRDELDTEISVRLVQEQTYYSNFFELIIALENHGFMRKGNKKMLVTNCWGLANRDGFVYKLKNHFLKNHFGVVKTTASCFCGFFIIHRKLYTLLNFC